MKAYLNSRKNFNVKNSKLIQKWQGEKKKIEISHFRTVNIKI